MPDGRLRSQILTTGCQTASLCLTKLVVTIYVIKRFQVFLPLNVVFFNPDGCGWSRMEVSVRDAAEAAKAARYHHRFIK